MKLKVSNKSAEVLVVFALGIISFIISNVNVLAILGLLQFFFLGKYLLKKGFSIVSFPIICLITSFMFHMFSITIACLTNDFSIIESAFWRTENNLVIPAIRLYLGMTAFFGLGCALTKDNGYRLYGTVVSDYKLKIIGFLMLAVGIGPKIAISIDKVNASRLGNYLDSYDVSLAGRGTIATLVYSSVLILLFAYRENKKICNLILILSGVGELFYMLSGNRFMSLSFFICMFIIYFRCVKKQNRVKTSRLIIFTVLLFVIASLLNAIREIRTSSMSLEVLIPAILYQLKNNPLIGLGLEMGGTMNTVVLSIEAFPEQVNFAYGKTFLCFLLSIFKVDTEEMQKYLFYIYNFRHRSALGGSFIGELYFNFSYLGIIAGIPLGVATSKVEQYFQNIDKNRIKAILMIPIMLYSFSYIRGYFGAFRISIYHIFVIFVFVNVLENVYIGKKSLPYSKIKN